MHVAAAAPVGGTGERLTVAEMVRKTGYLGDPFPTHLPTLNRATRGGLRPGFTALGGAPGAGKTSLLATLGHLALMKGHPVVALVGDERWSSLAWRIAQSMGFNRERLEARDASERLAFAERLEEGSPFFEILECDAGWTIDDAATRALVLANNYCRPAFLLVDSLQQSRADREDGLDLRACLNVRVEAMKRAGRSGLIAIATSELARGAYRSRQSKDNLAPLASFKESGGVEYGADCALVLTTEKAEGAVEIVVEVVKNRWGDRLDFRARQDRASSRVEEIPGAPGKAKSAGPSPAELLRERVLENMSAATDELFTRGKLVALLRAKGQGCNDAALSRAVGDLLAEGLIVNLAPSKRQGPWQLRIATTEEREQHLARVLREGERERAEEQAREAAADLLPLPTVAGQHGNTETAPVVAVASRCQETEQHGNTPAEAPVAAFPLLPLPVGEQQLGNSNGSRGTSGTEEEPEGKEEQTSGAEPLYTAIPNSPPASVSGPEATGADDACDATFNVGAF